MRGTTGRPGSPPAARSASGRQARRAPRKPRATLVLLVAVAAALLLGLAASAPASAASASPSTSLTFRVGWLLEPENLNPYIGLLGQDYEIWHLNYDFLVGFDTKTLAPRPEIATSWQVSADGKTWTFKIRQGVKWQDGKPLTAEDVAFSYNYIVKNNLQTLAIYTGGIVKATAVDASTVTLTTSEPKANTLAMVVPIVPEHIWGKISGKAASTSFANPIPIVGSGPFQVVEWQKGKFIRLKANKSYWGGAPKVDEVIFETYTNADTMTADLKAGAVDAAIELPQAQFPALQKTPGVTTLKGTHWRFNELGFNCYDSPNSMGNPVLLDQKFRHALNWAIDRQKITSIAFSGQADPGSSLIVPYSPYHWEPPADLAYSFDPTKAKAELAAAGYKDVNGDGYIETKAGKALSLRLFVTTDSAENQSAARLITGWFKDVGVKVQLRVVDSGALLDAQYNYKGDTYAPDYDMYIWYWTYDVDPEMMLGVPTPQQIEGWNDTLWTNPEYTRLFTQQEQTIDQAKRIPLVQRMQQIVYESSPYLIFAYPYQLEAYRSDKWQGVTPAPTAYKGYDGSAFYNYMNVDSYRLVQPVAAETSSSTGGGGGSSMLIAGVVIAALAIAAAAWLLVRRSRRSVEE
jgi:peptide/nickel transport system substrate-binding protein